MGYGRKPRTASHGSYAPPVPPLKDPTYYEFFLKLAKDQSEMDPHKPGDWRPMNDASARVLNQDEIDSLLGFGGPELTPEQRAKYSGHLRQSRCDLQNEVAGVLDECEQLLVDALDPAQRGSWRKRAAAMVKRLRAPHMFD